MTLVDLIQATLGPPPLAYEYLVYKTACVLLVVFNIAIFLIILLFQRSFQRGSK